jgi:hypothetical protein
MQSRAELINEDSDSDSDFKLQSPPASRQGELGSVAAPADSEALAANLKWPPPAKRRGRAFAAPARAAFAATAGEEWLRSVSDKLAF